MSVAWFRSQGLTSLEQHYVAVNAAGNRRGT
jgi:hypothetical protein